MLISHDRLFQQFLGDYQDEEWYEAFSSHTTVKNFPSLLRRENLALIHLLSEAVEPWLKEYPRGYFSVQDMFIWVDGVVLDALADDLDKFVGILRHPKSHRWCTLKNHSAESLQNAMRAQVIRILKLLRRAKGEPLLRTLEEYFTLRGGTSAEDLQLAGSEKALRSKILTEARGLLDDFWVSDIKAEDLEKFIRLFDELNAIATPSPLMEAVRSSLLEEQEEKAIRELWVATTAVADV